jgi:ABC-type sugar transport system ATPase subunit
MLLDEATAALTGDEVEFLKSLIAKTRERAAIIYVSHRLSEVLELSDRLYVLKDGSVVASMPVADATKGELHERVVGRTRREFFYREHLQGAARPETALTFEISLSTPVSRTSASLCTPAKFLESPAFCGWEGQTLPELWPETLLLSQGGLLFQGERYARLQSPR